MTQHSQSPFSRRSKRQLAVGDVFALQVEQESNKHIFIMFLGLMKPFGEVFTCFNGTHPSGADLCELTLIKYSFVSSKRLIDRGEWNFCGNYWVVAVRDEVFAEVYYNKSIYHDRADIGPYGSAKRQLRDGSFSKRDLTEEEARSIGILGNRKDMVCQPEVLIEFLREKGWI